MKQSSRNAAATIVTGLAITGMVLWSYWQIRGFSPSKPDEVIIIHAIQDYLYQNGSARIWLHVPPYTAFWPIIPMAYLIEGMHITGSNLSVLYTTNLMLHILCALTLFAVLLAATGRRWPSVFAAALFALHPINAEVVASLHLCVYTFSTFFFLIAVGIYITGFPRLSRKRYLAIFVAWTASLLSHPGTIHLPVILLVLDFWMAKGEKPSAPLPADSSGIWRRYVVPKLPFFAFGILWTILAMGFVYFLKPTRPEENLLTYLEKIPLTFISWIRYLHAVFQPFSPPKVNTGAELFGGPLPWIEIGIFFLIFVMITGAMLGLARKHRFTAAGWLWFTICLIPFIAVQMKSQKIIVGRYTYLPAIGIFIIISWGSAALLARFRYRTLVAAVLAPLVLLVLMLAARHQARHWEHVDSFIEFASPRLSKAAECQLYFDYGRLFFFQGDLNKSIAKLRQALSIRKASFEIHNSLGVALAANGNYREALIHFRRALALNPHYIEAPNNLANLLADMGLTAEAITYYRQSLRLNPTQSTIHNNLATALAQQGEFKAAVAHLEKSLAIKPDYSTARANLGRIRQFIKQQPPASGDHP